MIALLSTTVISCSDALAIINRLSNVIGLSYTQKIELIRTLKDYVPSCPIIIKSDEKQNTINKLNK